MTFDIFAVEGFWKNSGIKLEIAHNAQFLLLPQCFQFYLVIKLSFIEICNHFCYTFSKSLLQICCMWERDKTLVIHHQLLLLLVLDSRHFCTKWNIMSTVTNIKSWSKCMWQIEVLMGHFWNLSWEKTVPCRVITWNLLFSITWPFVTSVFR